MGIVGRLDQYASMLAWEFDDYSMSENLITHSSMSGWIVGVLGSGGSLPTGWVLDQQQPGSTITIIGGGIENGLNYVDIRFTATSVTSSNRTLIRPGNSVTTDGSTYYLTSYSKLVAGVSTNLTHINFHTGALSLTSTLTRNVGASAVLSGTFFPRYDVGYNGTGVGYDITIRFAAPQLEKGSSATDYTPTTGTAISRVLPATTNTNITGLGTYYSSGFDENIGFTTFLSANISPPYDPVYDEFGGTFFGAGQGRYMRQNTDKSVIVYNEIDEVTDFRDIVRSGLVLDLDAAQPLSYKGTGTTWTDLSGNGNTGTLVNMDSTNFNSANGGYLTFDGTNEYVTCGDPSSLNFGTGNFTISFVVYTTVYGFQGGSYVGKGNGTTIGFDFRDGSFFVYGTSGLIAQGAFAATLNVWEHHTIVYDNSSSPYVKFYKNGAYTGGSTTNTPANISSINTSEPLRIGLSVAGGPTRYFNGRMPLVQAYNRALTAAEITQNYNALRHRFGL